MASLTLPLQSFSSLSGSSIRYSFPQKQPLVRQGSGKPPFSQIEQFTSKIFAFHPVWSFCKSITTASAEPNTQIRQETVSNFQEVSSTFFAFETWLHYILSAYSLQHIGKVQRFLEDNQFILPLLLLSRLYIERYFPGAEVLLDIETDADEGKDQQLVALIVTSLSPDEAFQHLQEFDEQWWLDVIDQTQMKLSISLEFK